MSSSSPVLDHLVLGAGLAGLAYAWRRVRQGRSVRVLVGAESPQGPDAACAEVVLGEAPHLEALLASLPEAPRLVGAERREPLLVATTAGLRPLPGVIARRPLRGRRVPTAETLGAVAGRTWGVAALRRVVEPAAQAIFGTTPERLGALETLPALAVATARGRHVPFASPRIRALLPGAGALVHALTDALGEERVQRGAYGGLEGGAGGPRVETENGIHAAREVVLALAASDQARLLDELAPDQADALAALPHGPVVSARLRVPRARVEALPPCAALVVSTPGARVRACLPISRLDPEGARDEESVVQVWMTGRGDEDLAALSDDLIGRIVVKDLAPYLGGPFEATRFSCRRLRVPAPPPGQRGLLARLTTGLSVRGIRLLGPHVLGVGLDAQARAGVPIAGPLPPGVGIV